MWPCLLWWAVLSLSTQRRIDGVAEWHVRECCDVLRSPPGQQGDRGPFSTTTSAVTLMKDGLALVWSECFIMVMYGAAGLAPALGRVCVHLCGSLAKCFPSVKRCCCSALFSPLDLHHRAGGLHYSLNSIHDFMENHSPKWSCLFSFSHLNTQEEGLKKELHLQHTL